MEKFENQLLESYESALAKGGKEICKEVDSLICENDELMLEKASTYSYFLLHAKRKDFDPKLIDKCKNYLNNMQNYNRIKHTLEDIEYSRKMV